MERSTLLRTKTRCRVGPTGQKGGAGGDEPVEPPKPKGNEPVEHAEETRLTGKLVAIVAEAPFDVALASLGETLVLLLLSYCDDPPKVLSGLTDVMRDRLRDLIESGIAEEHVIH